MPSGGENAERLRKIGELARLWCVELVCELLGEGGRKSYPHGKLSCVPLSSERVLRRRMVVAVLSLLVCTYCIKNWKSCVG